MPHASRLSAHVQCFLLLLPCFVKEFFLEDEKGNHADGDGRIGYVEDGTKKFKFITADEGHPGGKIGFDDGEIKHIHHFAMKETGIAAFGWKSGSHYAPITF